jgi:hypothetical protein|uniref:Uncharacterized protein n=1 Tax=Ralstonia pickettii (strain 12D) TaxID=428406 RepID=C6BQM6_RALP1
MPAEKITDFNKAFSQVVDAQGDALQTTIKALL